MGVMASQNIPDWIIYLISCSGTEQQNHQSSTLLIHYDVNPPLIGCLPHKGQGMRKESVTIG